MVLAAFDKSLPIYTINEWKLSFKFISELPVMKGERVVFNIIFFPWTLALLFSLPSHKATNTLSYI